MTLQLTDYVDQISIGTVFFNHEEHKYIHFNIIIPALFPFTSNKIKYVKLGKKTVYTKIY